MYSGDYWTYLERDGTAGPTLNPGVPDTVSFVFRVPRALFAAGDELAIGLTDARPEEADLYEGTRWVARRVVAEVPVILREEG